MTAPSAFARELGLRYPIVQGPMNGASPPALAVAVSNAGALGSCAAALFSPAVILERVQQIRAQTAAPFNINLFLLDEQHPDLAELKRAQHLLRPFREALGLSEPPMPTQFAENNRDQIAALLEAAPPVVSFTFGVLPRATVTQFKKAGSRVIGTATTVAEARAWEEAGADFVCVSGAEAGASPDLPWRYRTVLRRPDGPVAAGGGGGEDPGDRRRRHHERARHRGGAIAGRAGGAAGHRIPVQPGVGHRRSLASGAAQRWR